MASFQNVDETLVLFVPDKGDTIAVAISGTYDQVIDLQVELGALGSGAWQTVKQFNTEDATEAFDYITKNVDENLRLLLRTDAGGDATVTLTDTSDKIVRSFKDSIGNHLLDLRQSGVTIPGTLDVTGAFDVTGALAAAGAFTVTGALAALGTLDVTGVTTLAGSTAIQGTATLSGLTSLTGNKLSTEAGVGITGAAETYKTSVVRVGGIIKTEIFIDITGLNSKDTDDDIIGDDGTGAAHLGQITAARNGTIFKGRINCVEVPVGGTTDIALWAATEATGVEDTLISALTATELIQSQNDSTPWELDDNLRIPTLPAAGKYLYLVVDGAGVDDVYSAGQFLIEFWGVT